MEITIWDDIMFRNKTVWVVENLKGIKKSINLLFNQKTLGEKMKIVLQMEQYGFFKALGNNIRKKDIILFSNQVKPVLEKILFGDGADNLTSREYAVLAIDFIFPIVYGETEINKESFFYLSLIFICRYIWNDMDGTLKKQIWDFCRGKKRPFVDYELTDIERCELEIRNYPEIKKYRIPSPEASAEESLKGLLKFKGIVSKRTWGHLLENFYKCDTQDISIDVLREAFDGLKREDLMTPEELEEFNKLPECIVIYRGTDWGEKEFRPSWTLDKDCASIFATNGRLYKAQIKKERVIAYWMAEKEIIAWVNHEDLVR